MYNRYKGNTGKVVRVEDNRPVSHAAPVPMAQMPAAKRPVQRMPLHGGSLSRLIPSTIGELDTEDIILLLILYLMYRDSGDTELLIMMGAMFLL